MKHDPAKPTMHFPLDRVIPKAPPGALGGFLQRKLREYVEPSRAGTPKGEPVGLSKQKYHAALLRGMTSLALKQIAREVHVSYDLMRKWDTEDPFCNVGYEAGVEFARDGGDFDEAAKVSLRLVINFGDTFDGPEEAVKKIHKQKLFGFDDGAFYSRTMLNFIINERHQDQFKALIESLEHLKPDEEPTTQTLILAGDYLGWTYCLDQLGRMGLHKSDKRAHEAFAQQQRNAQAFLNLLSMAASLHRPLHRSVQDMVFYVTLVQGQLFKN